MLVPCTGFFVVFTGHVGLLSSVWAFQALVSDAFRRALCLFRTASVEPCYVSLAGKTDTLNP